MNKNKINIKDFEDLKLLMESLGNEKLEMWLDFDRLFINGLENELMLRLNHYSGSLVIARIKVDKPGQGKGTEILNWIIEYAKNNDYPSIMIESTTTVEANRFAEKHGFKKIESSGYEEDGEFFGNWIKIL